MTLRGGGVKGKFAQGFTVTNDFFPLPDKKLFAEKRAIAVTYRICQIYELSWQPDPYIPKPGGEKADAGGTMAERVAPAPWA